MSTDRILADFQRRTELAEERANIAKERINIADEKIKNSE
jgi:hypothetical protein